MNDSKKTVEFTQREREFLDRVPRLLQENHGWIYITELFNEELDEDIEVGEFKTMFGDYMTQLANENEDPDKEETRDPTVQKFLEENKQHDCDAIYKLLLEYETWRKAQVEEVEEKLDPIVQKYTAMANSFQKLTDQFVNMI